MQQDTTPCPRPLMVERHVHSPSQQPLVSHYWARRNGGSWHYLQFNRVHFHGMLAGFCGIAGVSVDAALRLIERWNIAGHPWGYEYTLEEPASIAPESEQIRTRFFWARIGKRWRRETFDARTMLSITQHTGDINEDGVPPFVAQVYMDHWNRSSRPCCTCCCEQGDKYTLVEPDSYEIGQ